MNRFCSISVGMGCLVAPSMVRFGCSTRLVLAISFLYCLTPLTVWEHFISVQYCLQAMMCCCTHIPTSMLMLYAHAHIYADAVMLCAHTLIYGDAVMLYAHTHIYADAVMLHAHTYIYADAVCFFQHVLPFYM